MPKQINTKDQIIEAASFLFLQEGYEHVSMRKIASKVGCSPTNLYNHFKNKEEILLYLLEKGYSIFLTYLEKSVMQDKKSYEPLTKLRATLESYIRFGLENPKYYQLMFVQNLEHENLMNEESDRFKGFQLLTNIVKECIDGGQINGNELLHSQALWAFVHGITSLLLTFPTSFPWVDQKQLINHYLDTYLKGLTS